MIWTWIIGGLVVLCLVLIVILFILANGLKTLLEHLLRREAEILESVKKVKMILRFEDQVDAPDIPPDRGMEQRIEDYRRINRLTGVEQL